MGYEYVAIPREDTYDLIKRAQDGDEYAVEILVKQNTGLVKKLAIKYAGWGYDLEELMQLGYMGLLKAINNFDASYEVMFSTYAVPMILGEIRRFLRDDSKIKVSRQIKSDVKCMRDAREALTLKLGRSPKVSEVCQEMNISGEYLMELVEAESAMYNLQSLDDPETGIQEGISKRSDEGLWEREVDKICLKNFVKELEDKERKVIVLRYFKDMTQQQVANVLGISQVQVSRIEKRTLNRLKMAYEK